MSSCTAEVRSAGVKAKHEQRTKHNLLFVGRDSAEPNHSTTPDRIGCIELVQLTQA
jgi:hypothetical protein